MSDISNSTKLSPNQYRLSIHNWDKWQSYRRDRGQPPWIKIHRQIMRHPDWVALTDAERGQMLGMWLLAADNDGVLPSSPSVIKKLCLMEKEPDLDVFIDNGLIDKKILDAKLTPRRRQHDAPETETETETETEKIYPSPSVIESDWPSDYQELFWKAYPRRIGKQAALKVLTKIFKANTVAWPQFSAAVAAMQKLAAVKEIQFIPHPATWLNQGRWNDELTEQEFTNGHRGSRSLQDDRLSVSKAIGRLAIEAEQGNLTIPKRPGLLPSESPIDRRLLSKG